MRQRRPREDRVEETILWTPKTELGQEVFEGKISISEIFKRGIKIKEAGIVDRLFPNLQKEIVFVGGSPGKGGGSRRTPTKRTARMHSSGRRFKISSLAIVGNENGYFGIGKGEAKENKIAIRKAMENAKLNIIPVKRGCGSWECGCGEKHSIPFEIEGKAGSIRVVLKPAPKGIGLVVNDEAKKLLRLAGIKDVWCKSFGNTRSRINYMFALLDAFKKVNRMRMDFPEECEEIMAPKVYQEKQEEIIAPEGAVDLEEVSKEDVPKEIVEDETEKKDHKAKKKKKEKVDEE
jgi:small subunit ribosomal protein S5